jgi:phenylacetate-CoA ligase
MEFKESKGLSRVKKEGLREKLKYSPPWLRGVPPWMSKHVAYPTYLGLRGLRTLEFLKELEVSQWYDPEQMQALQLTKLKELLRYCQTYVPYYQKVFDSLGFHPEDLKTLDDLQLLPFLEKKTLAENCERIKTTAKNLQAYATVTSGSTGMPLSTYKDYDTTSYNFAAKFRAERWWNLDYGLRETWFWGRGFKKKASLRLLMGDWLFRNKIVFRTEILTDQIMYDYYQRMVRFRPDTLYVNPSAVVIFTRFAEENNLDMSMLEIKGIISTSEILHGFQREYLESVYECPVMNEYGASEVGIVAKECPKRNMHLAAENVIVEIVNDGELVGPNDFGEIVVTNLNNRILPMVRYKVGDVGRLIEGDCDCGVKLPLFDVTIGRDCDTIILEDRELPGGVFFSILGKELTKFLDGGLGCYKIYQKDLRNFLFQAVLRRKDLEQKLKDRTREIVRETLGENVSFEFEFVDHIPRESSGKLRYFVSEVFKDSPS